MAKRSDDPVLESSRREAWGVVIIGLGALVWTLVVCRRYGYGRSYDELRFVLGFPDWVFWGIVLPWGFCLVLSWWFAFRFMRDEDLGEDPDAADQTPHGGAGGQGHAG
jgi:hypothetical protein